MLVTYLHPSSLLPPSAPRLTVAGCSPTAYSPTGLNQFTMGALRYQGFVVEYLHLFGRDEHKSDVLAVFCHTSQDGAHFIRRLPDIRLSPHCPGT